MPTTMDGTLISMKIPPSALQSSTPTNVSFQHAKLSDNVTIDAGYRFKGILDPLWTGESLGTDYHGMGTVYTHNFQGAVSWGF